MKHETVQIWEDFSGALKGFILKRIRDRDAAEDILQEVFLKIHSGVGTLDNQEGLRAWLYSITRNAVIDHIRRRKKDLVLEDLPEELPANSFGDGPSPDDFEPCLRALATRLPGIYREPFILSELEGMSQKEMGENLGLSASTAKSRIQRGRVKMKEILLECCYFEFDDEGRIEEAQPKSAGALACFNRENCGSSGQAGGDVTSMTWPSGSLKKT